MKEIKLTRGKVVVVDDEDFEFLNRHKWYSRLEKSTHYAQRDVVVQSQNTKQGIRLKSKHIHMHREIVERRLGRKLDLKEEVDHIDHDGLNNAIDNLRVCDKSQNGGNSVKQKTHCGQPTSSIYKGVSWNKKSKKWRAYIMFNKRETHLGYFSNEVEAAKIYNKKAKELFGEFAKLNII